MAKDTRCRCWTFVVYPDSAPENWRDLLDDQHIEWVESPLHDRDLNATGELKKAHWHVLLLFPNVKAYDQIMELISPLRCTVCQKVQSAKGLVRYMAHLDNPEKVQYDRSLIVGHGGVDVAELLKPTASARYVLLREISEFILDHDVYEFEDLWFFAMNNRFDDWFPLLCDSSTIALSALLKSRRYKRYERGLENGQ